MTACKVSAIPAGKKYKIRQRKMLLKTKNIVLFFTVRPEVKDNRKLQFK